MQTNTPLLPSNKKFGFFFTFVFSLIGFYFYYKYNFLILYIFISLSFMTLFFTIFYPSKLLIFNKLWFRIGLLLSSVVSPVVLGIIFFLMITPIAIICNMIGRDELRLKIKNKDSDMNSFWIKRNKINLNSISFKDQF